MPLWMLRVLLVLVSIGVGIYLLYDYDPVLDSRTFRAWIIPVTVFAALVVIGLDIIIPKKRIEVISTVYFGVLVSLILAYLSRLALVPLFADDADGGKRMLDIVQLILTVLLCYTCISVLVQTKDDFRFIIPYVEFAKEVKGLKPYVLDTSVVIDGRIADVVETGVLDNQLVMPRFILNELQSIADSADKMRRSRGRRGLDILNRLRTNSDVDLKIYEREFPEMNGQPVDMKLVLLAGHLDGKVVTGDYNLNKVSRLHNVPVINLNDLANSLKPVFLPGEKVKVRIVKPGEEQTQGIGYLDDGTMIVVENGREYVGKTVELSVTSVLQKSAGRMIFGKFIRECEERE